MKDYKIDSDIKEEIKSDATTAYRCAKLLACYALNSVAEEIKYKQRLDDLSYAWYKEDTDKYIKEKLEKEAAFAAATGLKKKWLKLCRFMANNDNQLVLGIVTSVVVMTIIWFW